MFVLYFIAGVLVAVVVMMIVNQKKSKEYSDRIFFIVKRYFGETT